MLFNRAKNTISAIHAVTIGMYAAYRFNAKNRREQGDRVEQQINHIRDGLSQRDDELVRKIVDETERARAEQKKLVVSLTRELREKCRLLDEANDYVKFTDKKLAKLTKEDSDLRAAAASLVHALSAESNLESTTIVREAMSRLQRLIVAEPALTEAPFAADMACVGYVEQEEAKWPPTSTQKQLEHLLFEQERDITSFVFKNEEDAKHVSTWNNRRAATSDYNDRADPEEMCLFPEDGKIIVFSQRAREVSTSFHIIFTGNIVIDVPVELVVCGPSIPSSTKS